MQRTCPDCQKMFARSSNLEYHLKNRVCRKKEYRDPINPNDRLKLMIELKDREIRLAELSIELEKLKHKRKDETSPTLPVPIGAKQGKAPLNFGQERCDVFGQLTPTLSVEFLSDELLRKLHFNPDYPENWNLLYRQSGDYISVYLEDEWQDIYFPSVIDEYLRGNLGRMNLGNEEAIAFVESKIESIYSRCKKTVTEGTRIIRDVPAANAVPSASQH